MSWFEAFVVWVVLHALFLFANIEHYNWLLYGKSRFKKPMLYLVPCFWFLAFGFSAIAVAAGCAGTCEIQIVSETGVGILQLFCIVQMTLFTISNKLYFRYDRPK
jgi:hypothetical protein